MMTCSRNLLLALFSACITTCLIPAILLASISVGRVAIQQGTTTALRENGDSINLSIGNPIYEKDTLLTGSDGKLQIFFIDKSILTIGPSSRIVIDKFVFDPQKSFGQFLLTSTKGTFRMITGAISHRFPDKVKIQTPVATIGIRGCLFAWCLENDSQSLTLLYLGGREGKEVGIYAENTYGVTELTEPEYGLEVQSPEVAPSPPIEFDLLSIRNLMAPTEIIAAIPTNAPSTSPGSATDDDSNTDDDDYDIDADIDIDTDADIYIEVDTDDIYRDDDDIDDDDDDSYSNTDDDDSDDDDDIDDDDDDTNDDDSDTDTDDDDDDSDDDDDTDDDDDDSDTDTDDDNDDD